MAIIAHLGPRVDLLARFAVAGAEVAVVEHQRSQPAGSERLGEAVQEHLLDGGKAVGHDDRGNRAGNPIGQIQPAPQRHPFGVELDIPPHPYPFFQEAGCKV